LDVSDDHGGPVCVLSEKSDTEPRGSGAGVGKRGFAMMAISEDPTMRPVVKLSLKAALCRANVLLTGESGVGKAYLARQIHEASSTASRPFYNIFCLPGRRGVQVFQPVIDRLTGLQEKCGTIYIRGIDSLDAFSQRRLLGYLDDRKARIRTWVAGNSDLARLIFSSQKDLRLEVGLGNFLRQLYLRVSVITIEVPPLRDRETDVVRLAKHFINLYSHNESKEIGGLSDDAEYLLRHLSWEGNIHELRNTINRAIVLAEEGQVLSAGILKAAL
jgi:DNA-binding NtrC family response regulator